MKKFLLVGLALTLVGCGQDETKAVQEQTAEVATQNQNIDKQRDDAKQYFLSEKEPTVKDATWTKPLMFKVGVIDDGTNRDGFAHYVCETLRHDFKISDTGLTVEVIDVEKLVKTDKWIALGRAVCS